MRHSDPITMQPVHRTWFLSSIMQSDPRIGLRIGPYRLLRVLGTGGLSIVFEARPEAGDRADGVVAIKLSKMGLNPQRACTSTRAESKALARLNHPHIVQYIDSGGQGLDSWCAMERVQGIGMDLWMAQQDQLAPRIRCLLQVCAGVCHAHDRGVLHGDLKPYNVLVTADGTARIIDFTSAEFVDEGDLQGRVDMSGSRCSADYAAPERLAGCAASETSEVYALGVMLHEMLCGQRPLRHGLGRLALTRSEHDQHIRKTLRSAHAASEHAYSPYVALEKIATRCLRYQPSHRYTSVHALRRAIQKALARSEAPGSRGMTPFGFIWHKLGTL